VLLRSEPESVLGTLAGDNSMKGPLEDIRVTDHVHWVGAVDWSVRDFHGYSTDRGTTYNAYLIMADKIAQREPAHIFHRRTGECQHSVPLMKF
jgi:hypothetical protein